MATTTQPLKYLWSAYFADGHIIDQPADDRYSKHDDSAEHNPSSFRDLQEYTKAPIRFMNLLGRSRIYSVNIEDGLFYCNHYEFSLETTPLTERKLIYYREMQQDSIDGCTGEPYVVRYALGYEGKNPDGKIEKKVIFIDA